MREPASGASGSGLVEGDWSWQPVPSEEEGWMGRRETRLTPWAPARGAATEKQVLT